jgi:hypothetical protein
MVDLWPGGNALLTFTPNVTPRVSLYSRLVLHPPIQYDYQIYGRTNLEHYEVTGGQVDDLDQFFFALQPALAHNFDDDLVSTLVNVALGLLDAVLFDDPVSE